MPDCHWNKNLSDTSDLGQSCLIGNTCCVYRICCKGAVEGYINVCGLGLCQCSLSILFKVHVFSPIDDRANP
jgi:hypothetical protein